MIIYGAFKAATTNIVEQVCKYKNIKHVIIYLLEYTDHMKLEIKSYLVYLNLSRNESIKLTMENK